MVRFVKSGACGMALLLIGVSLPSIQSVTAKSLRSQIVQSSKKRPTKPASRLLPFFDQDNNPVTVGVPRNQKVDITPVPPQLNAFDQKVLDTCGTFGSKVSTISIRRLLSESPQVVQQIKQTVGGEIFSGRRSENQFRDDLVTIWSDRSGFEHIFCGQMRGSNQIGGLHFVGRYLQLQNQGIAGRLPNNSKSEEVIDGEIYTLGVEVRQGDRIVTRDSKKGYSYVSNAQELLVDATRAFKSFRNTANANRACLYTVRDASAPPFKAVFVKTNRAIVTFYPDATPKPNEASCE
ncbi:MAG: EndoU domain-containing protein [Phormidesmis sp. CAN_BIN44]|nr:EndoU domain-containing protein [Phormidesmis sp. CAN_BIN44]